jgi:hypothetical protein
MRHCLSCNCPEEQPASFQDGLCEPCFLRLEKLRAPFKQYQIAAPIQSMSNQPRRAAGEKLCRESPPTTYYASTEVIGAFCVALGFFIPNVTLATRPGETLSFYWGTLLSCLGLMVLSASLIQRLLEPFRRQNFEMIQLLKKIAEQKAPQESEQNEQLPERVLTASANTNTADAVR